MPAPNPAETFLVEAEDLLTQIEESALELEVNQPGGECVHRLFRAFHTIKGSGAMFGFEAVAEFTHGVETTLDRYRTENLPVTAELVETVLSAKDEIKRLLEGKSAAKEWAIGIRLHPDVLKNGTNPRLLLDELAELGECQVRAHWDAVPALAAMDVHACYVHWDARLRTEKPVEAIRDVFIFVEDGSEIRIGEAKAKEAVESARQVVAAKAGAAESTVRVPASKLDRLVNLVGELVMNQSRLSQATAGMGAPELAAPVEEIERLVSELRETVLGIRMMPIGVTFHRFKRLVHDLSAELGKEIDLVTEGAETELDKTVLDQLGDPLVHLIRNSVDHGIESGEQRRAAGKAGRGTIRLAARHMGSNVVVTIEDDGRGLNAEAIRGKAIERGLIGAEATLSEREIFQLIFLPGFSMAKEVTSVSGRGVGMDVVKRQVEALRGSVNIASTLGKGTVISLTLPLTLAIIDGLLVEIGGDQFIAPMAVVTENVELHRGDRAKNNGRNVVAVRGELIPYLYLRELFSIDGEEPEIEKIVIVRHEEQRVGLVVDRVLGSHQTVIQSLGTFYRNIDMVSGATIMGDGRVALILNMAGLVQLASQRLRTEH